MAVSDEQYVRAKHVKAAANKIRTELAAIEPDISVATTTSDGTVKILSDEDLDAYLNAEPPTLDGTYVASVSQVKRYISQIGSGGSGVGPGEYILWEGNSNSVTLEIDGNINDYDRVEVYFTFVVSGQGQDFVGFNEAPYEVAINDTYVDSEGNTGPFYLEVFSDGSFQYYNPEYFQMTTITKVVGIIN